MPHALPMTDYGKTTIFYHMTYHQLVMIIRTHYVKFKATLNSNIAMEFNNIIFTQLMAVNNYEISNVCDVTPHTHV